MDKWYPSRSLLSFFPLLLAQLLLTGCEKGSAGTEITVTDSAGVTVVSIPGGDRPLAWKAERVLEIHASDTEDRGFFGVTDIGVLSGDRIAVLDGDGKQVVLFDDQGNLLSQYGREGSGPGEFKYPLELVPTPEGGLFVYDMMNARFERFDSTLTPLASEPLRLSYYGGHVGYAGSHLVLSVRDLDNTEMEVSKLMAFQGPDTLEIARSERPLGGVVELKSCGMSLSGMPPLFSPRTLWGEGSKGEVAVADKSRYEVDIYGGPKLQMQRRVRRELSPIRSTREMAAAEVGDAMRVMTPSGERVCDSEEVVEQQGYESEVPPISGIAVSPSGEIFVQRWAPRGEERAIDVLSPHGDYLGTLAPGFPFPQAFLGPDRILVREEDEMEVPSVVVYGIQR